MDKKLARILLIEDDATIAEMYKGEFERLGFEIYLAHDGQSGRDQALSLRPDLILLDIALPKMDGIEVMQELRKDTWGQAVPIVILTNLTPTDDVLNGIMSLNPAFYLVKANILPSEVASKVKEVLKIA